MSDEEFVRANWAGKLKAWNDFIIAPDCWKIQANYSPEIAKVIICVEHGSEVSAWSAAAEFTRDRLEQIRQLQREIVEIECIGPVVEKSDIERWAESLDGTQESEDDLHSLIMGAVASQCAYSRTIDRLQAILADLKRGMKERP